MTATPPDTFPPFTFGIHQEWESLDSGWRTFPGHYLLYASSGTFTLEVDERQWWLPPQRAAWVRAEVLFRLRASTPVTNSSVLFAVGSIPEPSFMGRVFAVSPLARDMIRYAVRWGMERDPEDVAANTFFAATAQVCAELAQQPEQFWLPRAHTPEVTGAMAYVLQHLGGRISLEAVADAVNVSTRTLTRRFQEEAHLSVGQFIQRARLLRAMELLLAHPDAPILEIAYTVGFESVSAFNTAFRQFTQETPSQYRKRLV